MGHLWEVALAIRAYSSPYVLLILLVSAFVAQTPSDKLEVQLGLAFAGILLVQFSGVFLNDLLHSNADQRGERHRDIHTFFQQNQIIIYLLPIGWLIIISLMAIFFNKTAIFLVLAMMGISIIYGLLKSYGLWSLVGRGGMSLLMATLLPASNQLLTRPAILTICFICCIDVTGNLLGDIRDIYVDKQAGVQTTVVRYSKQFVTGLILLSNWFLLPALLWQIMPSSNWLIAAILTLFIMPILSLSLPILYTHFTYLMGKYLILIMLLAALTHRPFLTIGFGIWAMLFAGLVYRAKHFQHPVRSEVRQHRYWQTNHSNNSPN